MHQSRLLVALLLLGISPVRAEECPQDAGLACDSISDSDQCKEGQIVCTSGSTQVSCERDGALGYWPMDDIGPEVLDLSGAGLHAIALGGVSSADGKLGKSLSLNGTNGRIRLADFKPLRISGTSMTVAAWVYPEDDTPAMILHKGGQYGLRRNSDGSLSFGNSVNMCFSCVGKAGFVGKWSWSHVAAVWDGQNVAIYINGALQQSFALVGAMTNQASVPYAGCYAGEDGGTDCTKEWFNGRIDELVVYDHTLTAAQILSLTSGVPTIQKNAAICGSDKDCDGQSDGAGSLDCTTYWKDGDGDGYGINPYVALDAVGYWPMDEGNGITVNDLSGHLNHGTCLNTPLRRNGRVGKAHAFDGLSANSRLHGGDADSLDLTTSLSISAWIKVGNQNVHQEIMPVFDKKGTYQLGLSKEGKVRFEWPGLFSGAKYGKAVGSGWVFIVATWSQSSGTLSLYSWPANGSKSKKVFTGITGTGSTTNGGWAIGQYPTAGHKQRFDGLIDEVAVFKKRLSDSEIDSLYNNDSHRCACSADSSYKVTQVGDCNDSSVNINPAAVELCDSIDQNCNLLLDDNADADCDDGKSCTIDSCNLGTCSQAIKTGYCEISGSCYFQGTTQPGQPCYECNPTVTSLIWSPRPDGAFCTDDDACTVVDKCAGTVCVGTQKNCDDSNQCTSDSCALGSCTYTPVTKIIDCYTGPIVSKGVGPCKGGKAQCSNGTLGSCVGEVTPAAEACDGKDNDCDASIDEDFSVGAVCDSSDFDACKQGVIECTGTASTRCAGDGPVVWAPFETVTGIKTSNLGWGGGNVFMGGTAKQVAGTAGFGSGIQLNGVNDYVQFQNYPDLQDSQTNLSLAL